jgi:hypothetical protein
MSRVPKSIAWGVGLTAVMSGTAVVFFGLSDRVGTPGVSQVLYTVAMMAVVLLLPGSPLGLLAMNMHSAGFLVLAGIGDAVFYSFIAHRILARRTKKVNESLGPKQ